MDLVVTEGAAPAWPIVAQNKSLWKGENQQNQKKSKHHPETIHGDGRAFQPILVAESREKPGRKLNSALSKFEISWFLCAMPNTGKNIVLGVTGSIAAYKAADLTSQLSKLGHEVHVVMTRDAQEFITPLTLQVLSRFPVTSDLYDEKQDWHPGHIDLAENADLLVVAPATANLIARFARGLADDALGAIYLATLAPVLIAPAMNGKMWQHPATQENVKILQKRDVHFVGPEEGMLACGYEGIGRLWPVEGIVEKIESIFNSS